MSLMLVIKEKDIVHMIADSQVTSRDFKYNYTSEGSSKIFKVVGIKDAYMSHAGFVNAKTAVAKYDFDLVHKGALTFDDIVKHVVPNIIKAYEKYHVYKEKLHKEHQSVYLLIQKDKAFFIDFDFTVIEIDDFMALGAGQGFATSHLYLTNGLSAKEKIIKAIKYAASKTLSVSGPYKYVNTKDLEFEIIEGED